MSDKTATRKQARTKQDLLKKLDSLRSSICTRKSQLSAVYDAKKAVLGHLMEFVLYDSDQGVNQDTLNLVQFVISRYERLVSKG